MFVEYDKSWSIRFPGKVQVLWDTERSRTYFVEVNVRFAAVDVSGTWDEARVRFPAIVANILGFFKFSSYLADGSTCIYNIGRKNYLLDYVSLHNSNYCTTQ